MPEGPTATRVLAENNVVHYHPGETDDPIEYEMFRESELTVTMDVRGGSDATTKPPLVQALESGGCDVSIATGDTTIDDPGGYTDTKSWTLADDYGAVGLAHLVELNSGIYWPTLTATYPGASAVTPTFELPSAASDGNAVARIHTVAPRYSEVSSTATLAIRHTHRGAQASNQTQYTWSGCALAELADMEIAYGQGLQVAPVFHVADVAEGDASIATETFGDSAKKIFFGGSGYKIALADASTSSIDESTNLINVESVTFNPGITTVPVVGDGGDGVNGLQGYVTQYEPATVALTIRWNKSYSDDVEAGTFQDKYFHVIQGATTGQPCFGLWVPNMHLSTFPEPVSDGGYWKTTLTYTATIPGYNSETGLTDNGAAPWIMALGVAP
jgi:hypothetical protein